MFENSYEIEHMTRFRNQDIHREVAMNRQITQMRNGKSKQHMKHMKLLHILLTLTFRRKDTT